MQGDLRELFAKARQRQQQRERDEDLEEVQPKKVKKEKANYSEAAVASAPAGVRWGSAGLKNVFGNNCYGSAVLQLLRCTDWVATLKPSHDTQREAFLHLVRGDGVDNSAKEVTHFFRSLKHPFDGRTPQCAGQFF
eukprot:Sspe_Gene.92486::Locus_64778_Transcript_1_1_Confidence_1.000_Length_534::g.92486::m.92486